jgi:hypothetical protein
VGEKSPGWTLAAFNINGGAPVANGVAILAPKLPAHPCFRISANRRRWSVMWCRLVKIAAITEMVKED